MRRPESKAGLLDELVDRVEEVERLPHETRVLHLRYKPVFLISARDFVICEHTAHFESGLIINLFGSVVDERVPEEAKIVRADLLAGFALEPAEEGTRVIYVSQRDLKGKIPSWVLSKVAMQQG